MRRAARIHSAIELLDEIEGSLATGGAAADRLIDAYFRSRRYAGAGDRREVIRLVYAVLRNRGLFLWYLGLAGDQQPSARGLALAYLAAVEHEKVAGLAAEFTGGKFAPAPLSASERRLIDRLSQSGIDGVPPPAWARWNMPEWLVGPLEDSFGARFADEMAGLEGRATVDLRANTLKTDRATLLARLEKSGLEVTECPYSPVGLRLAEGARVTDLEDYRAGLFEIQDEAAQIAALLAEPSRGMIVVDLCAGAGGKTIAMAARMANNGTIHAYDVNRGRLQELEKRAKRAGVSMAYARQLPDGPERGKILGDFRVGAERVVLDVPCSGTGTWRRNPESRWRLTPERLAAHAIRQDALLAEAAPLVKSGGRLIYMTCSVLRGENADRAEAFLATHPEFRALDYRAVWAKAVGTEPAQSVTGEGPYLQLTPACHATDGFFVAIFERKMA
jgi:16S rRNA (cytosine967-C5)-methyltransferase